MSNNCIKINNISTIVNIIDENKEKINNNEYLVLMNALKKLYEYQPKIIKTFVCEGCMMEYCTYCSDSDSDCDENDL